MTYYPILKQEWGNYLIIAFIDNQFLTSICFPLVLLDLKTLLGRDWLRKDAVKTEYGNQGGS